MQSIQPTQTPQLKPEIMSPAGYWPQLHAAIDAGADSVYFGLKHFSARAKVGFLIGELPEVFRTLHQRGVKGFVTFNTLIFEHEIEEAKRAMCSIAEAGADAVIVQDLGICRLIHEIAPDLEIHASTQMSITSAEGVRFAQRYGARRVTLARELSLPEIRAIREASDCELEIFVHGALCVAYSGQCFSSEAWGGRSANRGQCAQACRLPYEMIVDDQLRPLNDARYLLSPGDLYALHHVPEIVDIGIAALKIEGRYKDADYVALATRAYRQAVDAAWEQRPVTISREEELRLEQVYSRGLGAHFLSGTNHQTVVEGRAPRHRGVLMGRVTRVLSSAVVIEPFDAHRTLPLKPGDGVVFDAADWRSPEEKEEGGRVFQVVAKPRTIELAFGNGAIEFSRIRPGDLVWRTHDPDLERHVQATLATPRKQLVNLQVEATEREALRTRWTLAARPDVAVEVVSEQPLSVAQHRAVDEVLLRDQLGRLGNTVYELGEIELKVNGRPFAPASLLNQLRREAVEKLQRAQGALRQIEVLKHTQQQVPVASPNAVSSALPEVHLLVRNSEQLDAAIASKPASITLDYLDLYGLKPSVERVKVSGVAVRVASPRVLKPGEERIAQFLKRLDCAILVRSAGLLEMLRDDHPHALIGDFSLNAANALTAATLFEHRLDRLTPTHDLNADQIAKLAKAVGPGRLEVVAYQHLPVFHTEHCVFCRFLSEGTSYKDCGRPCEKHKVALRDWNGREHPVVADVGCRNTVFGAEAQSAAQHLSLWLDVGIRHFRLEFVHEDAAQVSKVTHAFAEALAGRRTSAQLAEAWRRAVPAGLTEGSLFIPSGYASLPVLP
ncbi:MAG TPA: U32 family peptidase [Bryobacteraceae bacterium]|nr:U32 family peptidase [Bryobacteraceae bacterium]